MKKKKERNREDRVLLNSSTFYVLAAQGRRHGRRLPLLLVYTLRDEMPKESTLYTQLLQSRLQALEDLAW